MSSSERIARDIFAPVASSSSASASTPARSRLDDDAGETASRPGAERTPLVNTNKPGLHQQPSLYGTEDRVVLDLGSRIWKAGFSGEGSPRECKSVLTMIGAEEGSGYGAVGLWGLDKGVDDGEWEVREERLKRGLRDVWFNHLMSDPKARKVIVLENALLSTKVKEMIARVLFENLQVPSLSFASSHLLALMATGSVTGLVIDCGNLELTALPIYSSRPLFSHLLSSPRAGSQINQRLKSLLLQFGLYVPPPSSLNSTTPPVRTRIPKEVLTEELLEEIKCRTCFVAKGGVQEGDEEESFEDEMDDEEEVGGESVRLLKRMQRRWAGKSETTTISFKVPGFSAPPVTSGVGRGWIQVPGWVRERAAEVLWEKGDEDEMSLSEMVLEALLKSYVDMLRKRTEIPIVKKDVHGQERVILLQTEIDHGNAGRPIGPQYWDRAEKIKFMDTHGIDVSQIISLANPWLDFLTPEEAIASAYALNADLQEYCATYTPEEAAKSTSFSALTEKRLFGFGSLPLVPGIEVSEIVKSIKQIKSLSYLRGVVMGTKGVGKGLDDPAMEPVYEAIAEAGLVVFVHPHYGIDNAFGDRDNGHVLALALGFPFETSIAIARLILAGVYDRHPTLKLMLAHSAGALPALSSRLSSCVVHDPAVKDRLKHDFRYYLGLLYYDAVTYGPEELALVERCVSRADQYEGKSENRGVVAPADLYPGADKIMFGTDHPFFPPLEGEPRWKSVDENLEAIAGVPGWGDEERAKVMGGNAVRVFGLEV
ncbi:hypothetical protein MNV49_005351 [Pseudohyphozyma bogoriensis]|nr:hypothetical protein MNV49_005351 [Pseudohyphozyma bogoriensis]